jgi:hypothetical protein
MFPSPSTVSPCFHSSGIQRGLVGDSRCFHPSEILANDHCTAGEGKMAPEPVDREAMDLLFGSKASFLEKVSMMGSRAPNLNPRTISKPDPNACVAMLQVVGWVKETVAAGDEDKIVESLEELENQVTDFDNAGDLDSMGGVDVVLELIDHPLPKVAPAPSPPLPSHFLPTALCTYHKPMIVTMLRHAAQRNIQVRILAFPGVSSTHAVTIPLLPASCRSSRLRSGWLAPQSRAT